MKTTKKPHTRVVNLRQAPYDVYIGRRGSTPTSATGVNYPQIFGNPFSVKEYGRAGCIRKFKEYFLDRVENDPPFRAEVLKLQGKILGCFCKPEACHGDVIAQWVDKQAKETKQ